MRYTHLTTLFSFLVLAVSSALTQTPGSSTATCSGTVPGATPGTTPSGGLANWWWLILVLSSRRPRSGTFGGVEEGASNQDSTGCVSPRRTCTN